MKLCDLCGTPHESYQAHVFTVRVIKEVVNRLSVPVVNKKKDRHKKTEARRKYMAEYMRKRRGRSAGG